MVIKSLGFDPEDLPTLFGSPDLQVSKWGTIKNNFDTMETNLSGVFAAGYSCCRDDFGCPRPLRLPDAR